MSGFEVAGVVLGSLPLVISALEHYSEGLSTLQRMVRYVTVFRELHVIFEAAWVTYTASCERLLLPLAIPDQEFKDLIENPASEKWKSESLNQKLRTRLGPSYSPYKNATKELHKKVEKLCKKLKLDERYMALQLVLDDWPMPLEQYDNIWAGSRSSLMAIPPWITKVGHREIIDEAERTKFFNSKWARIKGGIDSNGCTKLVDLIMRDIDLISTLVKDTAELEGPRKSRQQKTDSTYWITVRDHAKRVFKSFESRWSQPCQCQSSHRANLQLDVRKDNGEPTSETVRFRFVLSFDKCSGGSMSTPWEWRDVEIETQGEPKSNMTSHSNSASVVHFSTSVPNLRLLPPTRISRSTSQPANLGPRITDLCNALKYPPKSMSALGYLDDQPWQHCIYGLASPNNVATARNVVSLKDIISSRSRGDISIKEKRALALKMALAVLQLHDTPWLKPEWDTKDISFITDSTGTSISLFEPSYVSHSFNMWDSTISASKTSSNGRIFAKNPLIFALGVALVELSYGEPLLARALPNELDAKGNETPNTEMLVAARLVKDIRSRELDNYAWATARCVECDMGYPFDYSLDDDGFRAKFLEGVIGPLKDDYDEIFSNKQR